MKNMWIAGLLALLWAVPVPAQHLRLMTYNVRHGRGMDDILFLERTARVVKTARPCAVALQEIDSMTTRCRSMYVMEELARSTGMHPSFAPAIRFQGGLYGVGMLSGEQPLSVSRVSLPGREEARTLLVVEFSTYVYACTHLSLTEADRMASLPLILGVAERYRGVKPFLLAGDLNDSPQSPFIEQLQRHFLPLTDTGVNTFPADKPRETIDYILMARDEQFRVSVKSTCVVPDTIASDHRPVLTDVRIRRRR